MIDPAIAKSDESDNPACLVQGNADRVRSKHALGEKARVVMRSVEHWQERE